MKSRLHSSVGFSGRRTGAGIGMCVTLALTGCRHAPIEPPQAGASSFVFVEAPSLSVPPASSNSTFEDSGQKKFEDFREAEPIYPLAAPIYPAKALAAKAGQATVSVRIKVDVRGRVSDVVPSLVGFTTPGRYAEDFREAVGEALRQWRFRSAVIEKVELVQTPQVSYSRVISSQKAETEFHLVFTFTSSGKVLGGAPGK